MKTLFSILNFLRTGGGMDFNKYATNERTSYRGDFILVQQK